MNTRDSVSLIILIYAILLKILRVEFEVAWGLGPYN
jgi:hypothetical protein